MDVRFDRRLTRTVRRMITTLVLVLALAVPAAISAPTASADVYAGGIQVGGQADFLCSARIVEFTPSVNTWSDPSGPQYAMAMAYVVDTSTGAWVSDYRWHPVAGFGTEDESALYLSAAAPAADAWLAYSVYTATGWSPISWVAMPVQHSVDDAWCSTF
jgi:hypothetical protein